MRAIRSALLAAGTVAAIQAWNPAAAQTWPARPLRAVVPVSAGSSTDIVPRAVLEQLSTQLGQPIVVENRAGAGGTIGAAHVARAEPDGYLLLASGSAHTIAPALHRALSYDPVRDFVAVASLGSSPGVLVAAPSRGWRTAADLVAAARSRPGGLTFASVGVGTATHLGAERFRLAAGIEALHVPFKGGSEAMVDVLAGRVDFMVGPVALVLPAVRSGLLAALAVNGAARSPTLPDVPTLGEAGHLDAEYPIWFGLFAPAGTPPAVVEVLHRETVRALQAPKVRDRLAALGVDPMPMSPGEFDAWVRREVALNATLVGVLGLVPQ